MINKNLLLLILLIPSLISIAQQDLAIKGVLRNNPEFKMVYLENVLSKIDLDSAKIDNSGNFYFKTKVDTSNFYRLRFSQEHYVLLVLSPGENVNVELDASNLFVPEIKGSKNSELVYNTYGQLKDFDLELQKLKKKNEQKKKKYLRKFIHKNSNSLSSLIFINNLSMEDDIEVYKKLDKDLSRLYPGNSMVEDLHKRVNAITALAIGSEAPEIDMPGLDGKNIKLTSLRGNYVLIDFWASWCGPCRVESPEMVALYEEYKSKGFEIFSVSLDNNQADWEAAVKKDGLGKWKHVSDLKYWSNAAAREYGVDTIPFTFLIDKQGKIIAKGLRGEELKAKLKEIIEVGAEKR